MLYNKLTVSMERVTAEKADEWLQANHRSNRKINRDRVQSYMHDMMSGNWSQNGETIKFDKDGVLIDGQHRLMAIKESGKAIWMLIARGVDENAFRTVDVGMSRTVRQILKMGGADDIRLKKNVVGTANIFLKSITGVSKPTQSMIEEFIDNNTDLLEWFYSIIPNSGNTPSIYEAVAIAAHINGVNDLDISGFIRGALTSNFDPGKKPSAYKFCVQAESWRNSGGRSGHYKTNVNVMGKYLYSYVNEMGKLTSKDDLYQCFMKSNYRLIAHKEAED